MTWNLRTEGQRTFGFAGPAPTWGRPRKGFREMGLGGRIWASQRRWLNRLAAPDAYDWSRTHQAWYTQAFARDLQASVLVTQSPLFLLQVAALVRHFRNARFLFMVRNTYADLCGV